MSDTYSFQYFGRCLGDRVPNGAWMKVNPSEPIGPLDTVAVILKDNGGPYCEFINALGQGGFAGVCKVFLGADRSPSGEMIYRVAQLNPPAISPIPARAIEAMHLVELIEGAGLRSTADASAIDLIVPYVLDGSTHPPVNPNWRSA